jgi:tetratricopeptide (TPR) repeat protein
MLKYYLFTAFLLWINPWAYAQDIPARIRTLQAELLTVQIDTTKLLLLNQIALEYLMTDYRKALQYIQEARTLSQRIDFPIGEIKTLHNYGLIEEACHHFQTAKFFFEEALQKARRHQYAPYIARCYYNLGNLAKSQSYWDLSIQYYLKALEISEHTQDKVVLTRVFHNLGELYSLQGKYHEALPYLFKSLKMWQKIDIENTAGVLSDIGNVYYWQKKYEDALKYYTDAHTISQKSRNKIGMAYCTTNIGLVHQARKQYNEALSYYGQSLQYYQQLGSTKGIVNCRNNIADTHLARKEYSLALENAHLALKDAEQIGDISACAEASEILTVAYEKKQDAVQALQYQRLADRYQDSLHQIQERKAALEIQTRYETQEKERENRQLKAQNEAQTWLRNLALLAFLLSLGVVASLFRQSKLRNQLLHKKQQLLAETEEKVRIERDLQLFEHEQFEQSLAHKERELVSTALFMFQKNELLNDIHTELDKIKGLVTDEKVKRMIHSLSGTIKSNLSRENEWESFQLHFEKVHPKFFSRLQAEFPTLTQNEMRFAAYLRINMTNKEIAQLLSISEQGVKMIGNRLRKKMNLDPEAGLRQVFLQTS